MSDDMQKTACTDYLNDGWWFDCVDVDWGMRKIDYSM
jgi:hypothetical protein